jgi:CubicO group peptidase (beta-lactamase class C family)
MRTLHLTLLLLGLLATPSASRGQTWTGGPMIGRFGPVHDLLQQSVDRQEIAGAVGVVLDRGRMVYGDAVGWKDVAAKEPMRRDTLFRMASMTKPVTSVAVMMLVEEGKIALTDPLSKFVPEFAAAQVAVMENGTRKLVPVERPITIHDLLTHTSGLSYGFLAPGAAEVDDVAEGLIDSSLSLEESTRRLAKRPLVAQPGSVWNYGMSTDVLGRVVEVASGQTLDRFFHDRIFAPLKMTDTSFVLPSEKVARLATLYRPKSAGGGDRTAAGDHTIEAVGPGPQKVGGVGYSATFQHPGATKYFSGGAGLVSTAGDYARFLQMLLNKGELDGVRLLKPETVELMTQNQIGDLRILFTIHGDQFGYGFGIHSEKNERNGSSIGTYSWGGIFHTYFWSIPSAR